MNVLAIESGYEVVDADYGFDTPHPDLAPVAYGELSEAEIAMAACRAFDMMPGAVYAEAEVQAGADEAGLLVEQTSETLRHIVGQAVLRSHREGIPDSLRLARGVVEARRLARRTVATRRQVLLTSDTTEHEAALQAAMDVTGEQPAVAVVADVATDDQKDEQYLQPFEGALVELLVADALPTRLTNQECAVVLAGASAAIEAAHRAGDAATETVLRHATSWTAAQANMLQTV